jgi:hypothetical protein
MLPACAVKTVPNLDNPLLPFKGPSYFLNVKSYTQTSLQMAPDIQLNKYIFKNGMQSSAYNERADTYKQQALVRRVGGFLA